MAINRRDFIQRGLGGASLALAFDIGGGVFLLTPPVSYTHLTLPTNREV